MEKQEISQLDLSRWVIVHETPFLAWIGEVSESDWKRIELAIAAGTLMAESLELRHALILQTTQVPQPGPRPGVVQMGIITTVTSPHSLTTDNLLVCVQPRAVTLFKALSSHDQHQLRTRIEVTREQLVVMRAAESGIVLPGGAS